MKNDKLTYRLDSLSDMPRVLLFVAARFSYAWWEGEVVRLWAGSDCGAMLPATPWLTRSRVASCRQMTLGTACLHGSRPCVRTLNQPDDSHFTTDIVCARLGLDGVRHSRLSWPQGYRDAVRHGDVSHHQHTPSLPEHEGAAEHPEPKRTAPQQPRVACAKGRRGCASSGRESLATGYICRGARETWQAPHRRASVARPAAGRKWLRQW
jgi:hypothetical protein